MKRKFDTIIYVLYAICVIMVVSFFIYISINLKNNIYADRLKENFREVKEYLVLNKQDKNTPLGVKKEYKIQVGGISRGGGSLVFYTVHQNVKVYIDNQLVYILSANADNPFGKTPGSNWNTVLLSQEDNRKLIKVVIEPVYESSIDIVPIFYAGSRYNIWMSIFEDNVIPFFMSILAIILGVMFMVFAAINHQNPEADNSLLLMGIFALNLGIWKLADSSAMTLLFQNSIPLAYVPYLALMLVEVPFLLYVRKLFRRKNTIIWYLPCIASICVNFLSIGLQVAGVADLRETLWMNHVVMVFMALVFIIMVIRERMMGKCSKELRVLVRCVMGCIIGLILDLALYYMSGGNSMMILGMIAFLVYIVVLGIKSVKDNRRLIAIGVEAKRYERMAYHDQLTGVYNRTAYEEVIGKEGFSPEDCIIAMFDLNNLKKCNDTLGHEKGDRYIKCSARLIAKTFCDIGHCYRIGGDEFCVLLKGISLEECKRRIKLLKKAAIISNRRNPEEFPIQIASGYEKYDSEVDYDLGDTLRRADKMMYHEKFVMKQNQNAVS